MNYTKSGEKYRQLIPIDPDDVEVVPGSGVYSLSDFIFYLAGMSPPKVRKSKKNEESDLQRLSIRNLLWYCYLDQDEIDSDFFHLGRDANTWKRLASRDVLRFVVGFHQEKVSELEEAISGLKDKRRSLNAAANALKEVLNDSSINSYDEIHGEIESLEQKSGELAGFLSDLKFNIKKPGSTHAVDKLKKEARILYHEIEGLEIAIREIQELIARDTRHLNEIQMLKLKVRRDESARAALLSVSYSSCPSCLKQLPVRGAGFCSVCGQEDGSEEVSQNDLDTLEKDADSRIIELGASINDRKSQLIKLKREHGIYAGRKSDIDVRLNKLLEEYDSAYLSSVIDTEKELISVKERIASLKKLQELPSKVNQLHVDASNLSPEIKEMNDELKKVREEAEKDTKNISKLEKIFLKMLLDVKFPGIKNSDYVSISSPDFLPSVIDSHIGDLAVTSFSNISSGGKKTIYKSCFSLAVHCLARATKNSVLPSFLIIDSPMKNISERENKEVFESFIKLIYSLAVDELHGTQFIIIDKEYYPPPERYTATHMSRHMQPDSDEFPPLIPYYKGH